MLMRMVHDRPSGAITAAILRACTVACSTWTAPANAGERAARPATRVAANRAAAARLGTRLYRADWAAGFGGWTTKDKKPLQGTDWQVAGNQLFIDGRNSDWARAPYEPGAHKIA